MNSMSQRKSDVFNAENILANVASSLITLSVEEARELNLSPAQVAELMNAAIEAEQAACRLRRLIHAAQPA